MPVKTLAKPAASRRIVAFDIIRGIFLLVILINHIELYPSGFDYFTGRGRLLVSAAEGFFFMSGLLVGLVYKRRLALGAKFIFKKMWTRAAELYAGSVILTLLFTYAAIHLNHPSIKYGLAPLPIDWGHTLKETLLMRYGFGWADFLDRFAILMLMAPLGFYLLAAKRWKLLVGASLLMWIFRGQSFTLSWQLIFFGGMAIGYHWYELSGKWQQVGLTKRRLIKRSVVWLTAITFALSYASVYILSVLNEKITGLPAWLHSVTLSWNSANAWVWLYAQKWTVGPLRIVLFLLWFTFLFMWVQRHQQPIQRLTRGLVELVGSNSFFVYVTESFIVFIFKLFIPPGTTFVENFLITAASMASLIGVVLLYKKSYPSLRLKKAGLRRRLSIGAESKA